MAVGNHDTQSEPTMRYLITFCLLISTGFCLLLFSGCISSKTIDAIAKEVATKIIEPPFELVSSTVAFQQKNGRWPNDYAELRSFAASDNGATLTNYDRVDFTSKPDGSVAILAIGPGMTNQMTLSLPKKTQP